MKIEATGNNDSSPFNRLPDEIVLHILNKIIDLKTLCFSYLVCKRFSSIVVQVDTISFTSPLVVLNSDNGGVPSIEAYINCLSFGSAIKSLKKFRGLKSLSINLPFPTHQHGVVNNRYLFKWKVKLGNDRLDSFLLLSPTSIYRRDNTNSNENDHEDVSELKMKIQFIVFKCLIDAKLRSSMLLYFITDFSLLEKVSITDSAKIGTVSISGAKIVEMRTWLLSQSETIEQKVNQYTENLSRPSCCYIPLLELPVSRYIMKGVTLFLMEMDDLPDGHDSFLDFVEDVDILEDNEEEVLYNEALMEILKKHKGMIVTGRV